MKRVRFIAAFAAALMLATAAIPAYARGRHCGYTSGELVRCCIVGVETSVEMLEQIRQERLEQKQELLQKKIDNGAITQEMADEIIERTKERQENCDGTGQGQGICDGTGQGLCDGTGQGQGICDGTGRGNGRGKGWRHR